MHLVKKLSGQGLVRQSDQLVREGLGYDLTMWRDASKHDADRRGTGGRRVEGRVEMRMTDLFAVMDSDVPLTLVLEDGRTLNFFVTNSKGRIACADGGTL